MMLRGDGMLGWWMMDVKTSREIGMGDTCGEKEKAHKEVVMAHKGSVLLCIFICESPFGGYVFICSISSMGCIS